MSKIILNDVTNTNQLAVINDNFDKLERELQNKVLYRDNPSEEPNQLITDVDVNQRKLYNLPPPIVSHQAARLKDVQNAISGATQANLISFTPYGTIAADTVQGAIQELVDEMGTGGGGGSSGEIAYGGLTLANFEVNAATPNSRVEFSDTNPQGWNTDKGRCIVSFDWIANNYWTLNPTAHVAVVTRCDTSIISTAVRGTGVAFGALPGHAPQTFDLRPFMVGESWVNGIGPDGRDNWLIERSETPTNLVLQDGVQYRTVIESTKDQSNIRYLRYRLYRRNTVRSTWDVVNDTGDMLDPNVQADLTQHGLVFGQVGSSAPSGWSISFTNIRVVWGPPGNAATDTTDKLSKRGAYLEGSMYVVGQSGTAELKPDGTDVSFNMYGWNSAPVVPKMYFKVNGTNVASVQQAGFFVHGNLDVSQLNAKIRVQNAGASSSWTAFQNSAASAGTNVLAIPSGTATQSAFTAINNSNASAGLGLSVGISGSNGYINSFNEAGGAAPEWQLSVGNSAKMRITSTGVFVQGQSVPLGTNTSVMQSITNLNGPLAQSFTNSSAFDMESIATLGVITSYLTSGGVFTAAQADRLEGLLRPFSNILSVTAGSARSKGCA
jgi:hypothetical protein